MHLNDYSSCYPNFMEMCLDLCQIVARFKLIPKTFLNCSISWLRIWTGGQSYVSKTNEENHWICYNLDLQNNTIQSWKKHLYTCSFLQLPHQPIMWLQHNAENQAATGDELRLMSTSNIRMEKSMISVTLTMEQLLAPDGICVGISHKTVSLPLVVTAPM